MTQLTLNAQNSNANVMLSMPNSSSVSKKANAGKNYVSYTIAPKIWLRKSISRVSSVDWDMNMNELEFE